MPSRTIKALLFVAMLSLFAADFTVGCGQGYVYGQVTQKYMIGQGEGDRLLSIGGRNYQVPLAFFDQVNVGDTVQYDGKKWAIVNPNGPKSSPNIPPAILQAPTP